MPAAPTIYRWDDPGAPALADRGNALYEVLMACLVNGYTDKPAAGWSVLYDEWASGGVTTLQNAAQSGVFGMTRDDNESVLFIASAMIDATSAINARSGGGALPDLADLKTWANTHRFVADAWRYWVLVANENFCIVWFAGQSFFFEYGSDLGVSNFDALFFGSALSYHGLGSPASADVGNFICLARTYQSARLGWDGWPVAVLSDVGAPVVDDFLYSRMVPWCFGGEQLGQAGGRVHLRLERGEVWASNSNSPVHFKQQFELPMLFSSYSLSGGSKSWLADQLSPRRFNEVVSVGGREGLVCSLPGGGYVFLSTEAVDWQ